MPLPVVRFCAKFFVLVVIIICSEKLNAQVTTASDNTKITIPASEKYHKSGLYRFFWGKHYRDEWHTPVTMPIVLLDTMYGGLKPYQVGGSRQTKSIRVTDKNNREYAFRSLDKTFGGALPPEFRGSFVEYMANDQVTIAHPYAGMIVAPLSEAANIYHSTPYLYYVPKQPVLGELNDSMGNVAYLFEKRPDENWETEPDFGRSKNIVSTEKMMEKTLEDNDDIVDQKVFLRARLFDILIGDWGRHEDQWRWATFDDGKKKIYKAIPRDRDNAFSVFDGFLLSRAIKSANAKHLQTFSYKIKDVTEFNFPARSLDRRFLTALTLTDWLNEAKYLQNALTDAVIEKSVRAMPPEVFPISGPTIIAKLKSRRNLLPKYAEQYYRFLSKEVSIPATAKNDLVEIKRLSDQATELNIYKISKDGQKKNPYYSRVFNNKETKEVRIFGIEGEDVWNVTGDVNKSIKFRLIGGPDHDTYNTKSSIKKNGRRSIIYDDPTGNDITPGPEVNAHLNNDSSIHVYDYKYFNPTISKIAPTFFYSNTDRFYVGAVYTFKKSQWRKDPYGALHTLQANYSLVQKAPSVTYINHFPQLVGKKWDLHTYLNYDAIIWTNFFGLGNESIRSTDQKINVRDFYRYRSREFLGKLGLSRTINNKHRIGFNGLIFTKDIIQDVDRFLNSSVQFGFPKQFEINKFIGGEAFYLYQHLNDSSLPTKGFYFFANTNYQQNMNLKANHVLKFGGEASAFIPLSKKFGFKFMAGATTLTGNPLFFQYNIVGNANTMRGFERDRYYGKSTIYNQNEFRFISQVRSRIYNGKLGLFALLDNGMAFLPGEESSTIHTGYGGGIILAPFNRISFTVNFAKSKTEQRLGFTVLRNL